MNNDINIVHRAKHPFSVADIPYKEPETIISDCIIHLVLEQLPARKDPKAFGLAVGKDNLRKFFPERSSPTGQQYRLIVKD
jgi:hypothetical protein